MILRRVTALCKLVIFWVVMGLSESFNTESSNDNSEPSDIVLPIGHLLGSNGVKGGFYRKSSKTSI